MSDTMRIAAYAFVVFLVLYAAIALGFIFWGPRGDWRDELWAKKGEEEQ